MPTRSNTRHDRGVIHRDLKPANILLQRAERSAADGSHSSKPRTAEPAAWTPKVTDFGLAKRLEGNSNLTGTGQILGTPSYMPPEQAGGRLDLVGPAADGYSLGAILYCLLTGRPPFQAANPMDTLLQVLDKEPVALRQLNPEVPRDLETIALKCLEKLPARRYKSARALAEDLQRYLDDEPILAPPLGPIARFRRFTKRRPVAAGCAFSFVGLLLVAGSFAMLALGASTVGSNAMDFFEDRATPALTVPLAVGRPHTTDPLRLPTPGLHELEVYLHVRTASWEMDSEGQASPHFNFRVTYAVLDDRGGEVAAGASRCVWNSALRRYGTREVDEASGVATVTPQAKIGQFRLSAPATVCIRCEIEPDTVYGAAADSAELRVYENVRDTTRASLVGGVACLIAPIVLLLGAVLIICGPVLMTTPPNGVAAPHP